MSTQMDLPSELIDLLVEFEDARVDSFSVPEPDAGTRDEADEADEADEGAPDAR